MQRKHNPIPHDQMPLMVLKHWQDRGWIGPMNPTQMATAANLIQTWISCLQSGNSVQRWEDRALAYLKCFLLADVEKIKQNIEQFRTALKGTKLLHG